MFYFSEALEKGLGCGLQIGSDATRMWMAYLTFLRRQIKWDQSHEEELNFFREAAQQAITMIDKCNIEYKFSSFQYYNYF